MLLPSGGGVICGPPFVASNAGSAEASEHQDTCGSGWTREAAAWEVARKLAAEFDSSEMEQVEPMDSKRKD